MAGSNRSPAHSGTQVPPSWVTPEMEAQRRQGVPVQGQDPAAQWPPQAYGHPAQGQAYPDQQAGYQGPGYQGYAEPNPYAQPGTQPPQGNDRFGAPQRPYDPHGHREQGDPRGYDPAQAQGQGYAPQGQQPAYQPHPAEQQSWDLAHYTPGQPPAAQGHYAPNDSHSYPAAQPPYDPRYANAGWPQQAQPQQGQPYDLGTYAPEAQAALQQGQVYQQGQAYYDQHGNPQPPNEDELGYEEAPEEAPRRGPRTLVVVGALIGAIAVGGGLAYGYKMFGGAKGTGGAPPVVKADKSPAKSKPVEPGGKDVANTDKKFLNRLVDDKAAPVATTAAAPSAIPAAAALAPSEPEAPRKVTTLIVNKDGTLTPQLAPTVPGMVVEGLNRPTPQLRGAAPIEAQADPAPKARVQPTPVAPPRVAELPLPKVRDPAEAKAAATVKKKPATRDDLLAQPAAVGAPPAAAAASPAGSAGFVAVLSSKRSRETALASFADYNAKYAEVLKGRVPDVREKDFGDAEKGPKGVWYRLVVGPPSSREKAREICHNLEAQGFKAGECFVMPF